MKKTKEVKKATRKSFTGAKLFDIQDFKAIEREDGALEISGYANTKYVADRYGDVPTEYNRNYVYDLTEFAKNPIMLLDHNGSVKSVAGSYVEFKEDAKGLFVRGVFTKSQLPEMVHARTLIKEGHLKTFSIGGRFMYENPDNYNHLTLAKIYEISIVAVPADPNALFSPDNETGKATEADSAEVKPAEKEEEKPTEVEEKNEEEQTSEEKPQEEKEEAPKEEKQEEKTLDFKPLAKKLTLFEIKQKIQKARVNIGRGAK